MHYKIKYYHPCKDQKARIHHVNLVPIACGITYVVFDVDGFYRVSGKWLPYRLELSSYGSYCHGSKIKNRSISFGSEDYILAEIFFFEDVPGELDLAEFGSLCKDTYTGVFVQDKLLLRKWNVYCERKGAPK